MSGAWQYGVSHVERGEVVDTVTCDDLEAAQCEAAECDTDETGRACFVVRRPAVVEWEPVIGPSSPHEPGPDGDRRCRRSGCLGHHSEDDATPGGEPS